MSVPPVASNHPEELMLLNVIRGAAIAAALGLISTAGAGATLRAVSVHPPRDDARSTQQAHWPRIRV